jgi:hypothetical protein
MLLYEGQAPEQKPIESNGHLGRPWSCKVWGFQLLDHIPCLLVDAFPVFYAAHEACDKDLSLPESFSSYHQIINVRLQASDQRLRHISGAKDIRFLDLTSM